MKRTDKKKNCSQIIAKIFSRCDGDLRKAYRCFEDGVIDAPFAPSKI